MDEENNVDTPSNIYRKANVYSNNIFVGYLTEYEDHTFTFQYDKRYMQDTGSFPISITFPFTSEPFAQKGLFSFFFNMLTEGDAKAMQCRALKIDENDHFGRLVRSCAEDSIGAVTVKEITHG